jgi:hypothetical protein
MNRNDFREFTPESVTFDTGELENQLLPVLSAKEIMKIEDMSKWIEHLSSACRDKLGAVLPFNTREMIQPFRPGYPPTPCLSGKR